MGRVPSRPPGSKWTGSGTKTGKSSLAMPLFSVVSCCCCYCPGQTPLSLSPGAEALNQGERERVGAAAEQPRVALSSKEIDTGRVVTQYFGKQSEPQETRGCKIVPKR